MKRIATSSCVIAAAALLAGAAGATAGGGNAFVRATGTCSPGVTSKLKAKNDGAIEVEFEVDQNRNGVRWTWRIIRDGATVRKGASRTQAPSGSFSVTRRIGNPAGVNRVAFRAVNSSGKRCRAVVRV